MRYAVKKKRTVRAYCLGEDSRMERQLIREGAIRLLPDGRYELFSQESKKGQGEIARPGDFFKVDTVEGRHYPYPNEREYFLKHHVHLMGDDYEQHADPIGIWQDGDDMCPEMAFLLDTGRLLIDPASQERYFNAELFGAPQSGARDAVVAFYSVERDGADRVKDVSFNFITRQVFRENYEFLETKTPHIGHADI